MQDYQIRCATDPNRAGYRRKPYSQPAQRTPQRGASARRNRFIPESGQAQSESTTESVRTLQ
jgi:DTW domain-containing protein